jgi:hypothetical protein
MISLWQLNRILSIHLIQSKHSNVSIASMNGVFLTSDESKLAASTSNAICTKQFLLDNCRG